MINNKEVFNKIFEQKGFGSKYHSGEGANVEQTKKIIVELPILFNKYNIKSLLDAPCGDFNYMQFVYKSVGFYTGADISDKLIERNKKLFPEVNFKIMDIKNDKLPDVDCLLCRDIFVHMHYDDIKKSIINIKKSKIKYLLTTTFPETGKIRAPNKILTQINTASLFWQPLNLQQSPLNFPKPLTIINENCTEENGIYKDKSLGLWIVKLLPDYS